MTARQFATCCVALLIFVGDVVVAGERGQCTRDNPTGERGGSICGGNDCRGGSQRVGTRECTGGSEKNGSCKLDPVCNGSRGQSSQGNCGKPCGDKSNGSASSPELESLLGRRDTCPTCEPRMNCGPVVVCMERPSCTPDFMKTTFVCAGAGLAIANARMNPSTVANGSVALTIANCGYNASEWLSCMREPAGMRCVNVDAATFDKQGDRTGGGVASRPDATSGQERIVGPTRSSPPDMQNRMPRAPEAAPRTR